MTDEADRVPPSAEGYKPHFEKRPGIPDGVTIDTKHPLYVSATQTAHRAKLTQAQFSALLTHEVETRVRAQTTATKPSEPAKIPGYDKINGAEAGGGRASVKARSHPPAHSRAGTL